MAKWGEGDPRWIVEERPDATNVNNWHWVEKNATPWSRDRLTALLIGQSIEKGPIKVDLQEFKKIEGEATANNRKAKLIFLFEWVLEIKFSARVAGDDFEYKGCIEIPNLSDENEADEVTINTNFDDRGSRESDIRHLLHTEGLEFIRKQLGVYIRELKEEFSKGIILPTDKPKPQVITKGKTDVDKKSFQNEVLTGSNVASKAKSTGPIVTKKLDLMETFKVAPDRLFEILSDPQLVQAWTNSSVKYNFAENGEFALFGGNITGSFVKIVPNKEIEFKWRMKKYPEGHFARVKFILRDQNDSTDLVIEATDVPEEHYDETSNGFTRYYMQNIGRTFGCGLKIY